MFVCIAVGYPLPFLVLVSRRLDFLKLRKVRSCVNNVNNPLAMPYLYLRVLNRTERAVFFLFGHFPYLIIAEFLGSHKITRNYEGKEWHVMPCCAILLLTV